jgi:hypothetical protein
MKIKFIYLPLLSVLGIFVVLLLLQFILELDKLLPSLSLEELGALERESGQAGRSTSYVSAYLKWSAMYVGLIGAWLIVVMVALDIAFHRRERLKCKSDGSTLKILLLIIVLIAIVGAIMETLGTFRWGGEFAKSYITDPAPNLATLVRNVSGWLAAAIVVIAQSFILASDVKGTVSDGEMRLRILSSNMKSLRMLMIVTGFSLAVGVAQVFTLVQLANVQSLQSLCSTPTEAVISPAHLVDLEQSLTLGAGVIFSTITAFCFLPTIIILERSRLAIFNGQNEPMDNAKYSKFSKLFKELGLDRSIWSSATEYVAVLLPAITGFAVPYL